MPVILTVASRATSVAEQPSVTLDKWRVVEGKDLDGEPTRHLLGIARETGKPRVSTALLELDLATSTARTESGRTYGLAPVPEAGHDDGEFVELVESLAFAMGLRDVTQDALAEHAVRPVH